MGEETKPRVMATLPAERGHRDPERGEMQSAQRPGPGRGGGGGGHPSTAPLSLPYHGGRNFLSGSAELGSGTALTPNSETRR